jgi:hypothetical protein
VPKYIILSLKHPTTTPEIAYYSVKALVEEGVGIGFLFKQATGINKLSSGIGLMFR